MGMGGFQCSMPADLRSFFFHNCSTTPLEEDAELQDFTEMHQPTASPPDSMAVVEMTAEPQEKTAGANVSD